MGKYCALFCCLMLGVFLRCAVISSSEASGSLSRNLVELLNDAPDEMIELEFFQTDSVVAIPGAQNQFLVRKGEKYFLRISDDETYLGSGYCENLYQHVFIADVDFDGEMDFFIPQGRGKIAYFFSLVNSKGKKLEGKLFSAQVEGNIANPRLYRASRQLVEEQNWDFQLVFYASYLFRDGRYEEDQSLTPYRILGDVDIHIFKSHHSSELVYHYHWDGPDDSLITDGPVRVMALEDLPLLPDVANSDAADKIESALCSQPTPIKAGSVLKIIDLQGNIVASSKKQQWLKVEDDKGHAGWVPDDTSLLQEWVPNLSVKDSYQP